MGKVNKVISSEVLAVWKHEAAGQDDWTTKRLRELIDSHETLRSTYKALRRVTHRILPVETTE